MISIDCDSNWSDSCQSISQSLFISSRDEPVVTDMGHSFLTVIIARLCVLKYTTGKDNVSTAPANAFNSSRDSEESPHHRGIRVRLRGLQAVVDYVVVSVCHPSAAAAVCTVRPRTVHKVLFAQGHQLTCLLEHLSFDGSCSAKGPTRTAIALETDT